MLILTQEARARIAAAVLDCMHGGFEMVGRAGALPPGCRIEIDELPLFELTHDGLRLGLWVNMSPSTAEEFAAATAPAYPGAWDGVTPVDGLRFEMSESAGGRYMCGYSGPGFYEASVHSCAAGYHAAVARLSRVDPT